MKFYKTLIVGLIIAGIFLTYELGRTRSELDTARRQLSNLNDMMNGLPVKQF